MFGVLHTIHITYSVYYNCYSSIDSCATKYHSRRKYKHRFVRILNFKLSLKVIYDRHQVYCCYYCTRTIHVIARTNVKINGLCSPVRLLAQRRIRQKVGTEVSAYVGETEVVSYL